jgi:hypothetical protein
VAMHGPCLRELPYDWARMHLVVRWNKGLHVNSYLMVAIPTLSNICLFGPVTFERTRRKQQHSARAALRYLTSTARLLG